MSRIHKIFEDGVVPTATSTVGGPITDNNPPGPSNPRHATKSKKLKELKEELSKLLQNSVLNK